MNIVSKTLIVLCLMCYVSSAFAQTAADTFNQAKALFEQGNYSEARPLLSSILDEQTNPEPGETYFLLLKCHFYLKDHDSVVDLYTSHHARVAGTNLDPAARFTYANSLYENAGDADAALPEYEYIVATFPDSPYAAPGSLYRMGMLNLEKVKDYYAAREKFTACITSYPESPYVPGSWLGILTAASYQYDTISMLESYNTIMTEFSQNKTICAKANFEVAEFYNKRAFDRQKALTYYLKVVEEYPDSPSEPLALLRAADLVPMGRLPESMNLYRRCLSKFEGKTKYTAWAQAELAFCYYILDRQEKAREECQKLLTMTDDPRYVAKAHRLLEAIDNPQSIAALHAQADAAFKKSEYCYDRDTTLWNSARIVTMYENSSEIGLYLAGKDAPAKDKAEVLYKTALAYHNMGEPDKALELMEKVIFDYRDDIGETRAQALYSAAFYYRYMGRYDEALTLLETLVTAFPDYRGTPRALQLMAFIYDKTGDPLSAAQIHQYVMEAYPETTWARNSEFFQKAVLIGRKSIQQQFAEARKDNQYTICSMFKINPRERYKKGIEQLLAYLASLQKKETEKRVASK